MKKHTGKIPNDESANLSSDEREFIERASEAGAAEVEMAQVVAERTESDVLKNFARKMIEDHSKAGLQLSRIASAKGAGVPRKLSGESQAELKRLRGLKGADFDREYVRAQLAAHKDAVALFHGEATQGRDSDLKKFANATLPTLREHLGIIQNISGASLNRQRAS